MRKNSYLIVLTCLFAISASAEPLPERPLNADAKPAEHRFGFVNVNSARTIGGVRLALQVGMLN